VLFLGTPDQRPPGFDWLEGIPSAGDVGFPDLEGAVTEMRVIVAPSGLSEEEVAFLEQAVLDTLNDPDFVAWAEGAERPLVPRDAASTREQMDIQIEKMRELVPELVEAGLI
jgi:tripartite-type tricarboxylate transporter receptor subunit TctC